MIKRIKLKLITFFLTESILLFTIGRAFAGDSRWSEMTPYWEFWGPFLKKILDGIYSLVLTFGQYLLYTWIVLMIMICGYAAFYFFQQKKPADS